MGLLRVILIIMWVYSHVAVLLRMKMVIVFKTVISCICLCLLTPILKTLTSLTYKSIPKRDFYSMHIKKIFQYKNSPQTFS